MIDAVTLNFANPYELAAATFLAHGTEDKALERAITDYLEANKGSAEAYLGAITIMVSKLNA